MQRLTLQTSQGCAAEGTAYTSKLNLVDLAGSERAAKTGASGATAREATYINKSLSFLEQVQYWQSDCCSRAAPGSACR